METKSVKVRLLDLSEDQWRTLISSLLFTKSPEEEISKLMLELKKVAHELDLIFRVLYNVSKQQPTGTAHDYFVKSMINLLAITPLNQHSKNGLEFLARYLKKIKPIQYRSHLLQILIKRGDEFQDMQLADQYDGQQLLLDVYWSVMEIQDNNFELYLFDKALSANDYIHSAYLYHFYLINKNITGSDNLLEGMLKPEIEPRIQTKRLIYAFRNIKSGKYAGLQWKEFYRSFVTLGFYNRANTISQEVITTFVKTALQTIGLEKITDAYAIPLELCYLIFLNDTFSGSVLHAQIKNLTDRIRKDQSNNVYEKIVKDTDKEVLLKMVISYTS